MNITVEQVVFGFPFKHANTRDKLVRWYLQEKEAWTGVRNKPVRKQYFMTDGGVIYEGCECCPNRVKVAHGLYDFWKKNGVEIMNFLIRRHTAWNTVAEMVQEHGGNYRPTIFCDHWTYELMADVYDYLRELQGDSRRAYRGFRHAQKVREKRVKELVKEQQLVLSEAFAS